MIQPGNVGDNTAGTLEVYQWKIARAAEVHKNLDGLITTATVKLPIGKVLKRTPLAASIARSCFKDDEKRDAVTEERPVISISQDDVLGATSCRDPSGATWHGDPRTAIVGEQKADAKYPGEDVVTTSAPEPVTSANPQDLCDGKETGEGRGKRAKRDPGYYTKLAKRKLCMPGKVATCCNKIF